MANTPIRPDTSPGSMLPTKIVLSMREVAHRSGIDHSTEEDTGIAERHAQEGKYRALLESIDQGYCVVELVYHADGSAQDYRFLEINPAFEKHTGFTDALGRRIREFAPDYEPFWFQTYGQVAATGQPAHFEAWSDCLQRCYEVYAYRIPHQTGQVGILFNDISTRKRHEAELRQADQRKTQFITVLAHELRNPLGAIGNGVQVIEQAALKDEHRQAIAAIMKRQVHHLSRLVDDLMDIASVSTGKLELSKEIFDLGAVVRDAVAMSALPVQKARHEVRTQFPGEPLMLRADRGRIAQCLINLLSNAAKYSPPGTPICVSVAREEGHAVISVRDEGEGIEAHMLGRIFDMFEQVASSNEHRHQGLGIGLSLVKMLVELHDGRVSAHSEGLGKGSEFRIRLPLQQ